MCSSALANFFIDKAKSDKHALSNLKLQKLMFIGYGWVSALTDTDITEGEGFQAWQHGPVLPSIYHQMKHYGNEAIKEPATDYDSEGDKIYIPRVNNQMTLEILEKVWNIYKSFSAWSLRDLTHTQGSPWDKVYNHNSLFTEIDKQDVNLYYIDYITQLLKEE